MRRKQTDYPRDQRNVPQRRSLAATPVPSAPHCSHTSALMCSWGVGAPFHNGGGGGRRDLLGRKGHAGQCRANICSLKQKTNSCTLKDPLGLSWGLLDVVTFTVANAPREMCREIRKRGALPDTALRPTPSGKTPQAWGPRTRLPRPRRRTRSGPAEQPAFRGRPGCAPSRSAVRSGASSPISRNVCSHSSSPPF